MLLCIDHHLDKSKAILHGFKYFGTLLTLVFKSHINFIACFLNVLRTSICFELYMLYNTKRYVLWPSQTNNNLLLLLLLLGMQ